MAADYTHINIAYIGHIKASVFLSFSRVYAPLSSLFIWKTKLKMNALCYICFVMYSAFLDSVVDVGSVLWLVLRLFCLFVLFSGLLNFILGLY